MFGETFLYTLIAVAVFVLAIGGLYRYYSARRKERGTQESYANMTPNATNYNVASTLPDDVVENASPEEAREILEKEKAAGGPTSLSNEDFYDLKEKINEK